MGIQSYFELAMGILIVILVFHDIFQGVVVPRWSSRQYRIAPYLIDWLWVAWRKVGSRKTDVESREDFMGSYAPFALMCLMITWVACLIFGYGVCFWALRTHEKPVPGNFLEAIYIGGETLLTIGYGEFTPQTALVRFIALCAGASGLAVFALVISFLFTLYGTFERREVLILTLDSRGGNPPSGVAILETYAELDLLDDLPEFFAQWEAWSAQVLQSHIAYPILPFFRSSHEGESWIAALGAVLDAATLLMTTACPNSECSGKPLGAAHLMYRIGCHTVIDLSHWFGFRFDEDIDPHPGVEKMEFLLARKRLAKAGFSLRDEDESWAIFRVKRAKYAASLNELAKHFAAPPAQWVGDRSMIGFAKHRLPERSRVAVAEVSALRD
jgi:hypothetical protein